MGTVDEREVERKKLTIKMGLNSNDNVSTQDTKMIGTGSSLGWSLALGPCTSNTTGSDTEDRMAGGRDGGPALEIAVMR